MKPLTAKQAVADILAKGWPGDREAYEQAVSRMVREGADVLGARLMVRREIKRISVTEAN